MEKTKPSGVRVGDVATSGDAARVGACATGRSRLKKTKPFPLVTNRPASLAYVEGFCGMPPLKMGSG